MYWPFFFVASYYLNNL